MPTLVRTPHAAIKIWNYTDRISDQGADATVANQVDEQIISTVSCMGIQTSRAKGDPVGTFNFILAPTRNWVSVITPGSWCVIMMSNEPITADSFDTADPNLVKMFGRIDTVRCEVTVDEAGARQTRYLVSGQDWGSIFNNIFYIDPLVIDPQDQTGQQGNALYIQIMNYMLSKGNTPQPFDIPSNLQCLLSVFGSPLNLPDTNRIATPTHNILIPQEALNFFGFLDATFNKAESTDLTKIITLQTGALNSMEDSYDDTVNDGTGWLDPFSMLGSHTLWSILMDNNNYALNELYPEMRWLPDSANPGSSTPQLTLYNRIKPFSFQDDPVDDNIDLSLRAKFQNIATHKLDDTSVVSVNAGTNWRDKFNFVEIKPDLTGFKIHDVIIKQKSQAYQKKDDQDGGGAATDVFDREGFRPLIFSIKQIPFQDGDLSAIDGEEINQWVNLMQEWYFDTHRLLNGRLVMTGSSEYIPVGDNIMFDAGLIGVTPNYNNDSVNNPNKIYILAHVEAIQHNFSVNGDGTRSFQTTIQFVRGIIVDESKNLIGGGTIDTYSVDLSENDSENSITVTSSPTGDSPNNG